MAETTGREYVGIKVISGDDTVLHPYKDATAREDISDLQDAMDAHFSDTGSIVATGATASASHALATGTGTASGEYSTAVAVGTQASGLGAFAEGNNTIANHKSQHVSGEYNVADTSASAATERGDYIEIVGNGTDGDHRSNARTLDWSGNEELAGDLTVNAGGVNEVSVGDIAERVSALESGTGGVGDHFQATGRFTVGTGSATQDYAIATGQQTVASGVASQADGVNTVANHKSQRAFGEYNVADTNAATASERGDYIEIVGNGTADNQRSNARTLDWAGNETIAGSLTIGGNNELNSAELTRLKNLTITNGEFSQLSGAVSTLTDVTIPAIRADLDYTGDGLLVDNDKLYLTHNGAALGEGVDFSTGVGFDSGYVDEQGYVHITLNQEDVEDFQPFYIGTGGGSTSGGAAAITRITNESANCIYGEPMVIEYGFTATDASGDTVGDGTGTWYVGGVAVATNQIVHQGNNSFDISSYLSAGLNNVRLEVKVDTGGETLMTAKKTWSVNAVNMYFTWTYNDARINTTAFDDRWTPYGDIAKTTHTMLDGVELPTSTTVRSGVTQSMTIPMQTHGAHSIERWLTAEINGVEYPTPHQYHEAIFAVEGNTTPIVAISMKDTSVRQYDTVEIPVVVYNPTSMLANATLSVNNTPVGAWTDIDRSVHTWTYTPTESGTQTLRVTCGTVSASVVLTVSEVDFDIEEVSGYSFRFKASEMATNNAVRSWTSNGVTATFSDNFDWINGGLHTEKVDSMQNEVSANEDGTIQQYFCIKAGTTMTINHKLFENDPKSDGMNYKMIFKVKNVRDYDAQIGHCYADNVGIRMYAHKSLFNSSGTEISVPYGEDEYIELEFDVYPAPVRPGDGNYRYMMAWADGVITSCRVYGENDNFAHSPSNKDDIVLGSADCDIYLYMIKAYPFSIDRDKHIDNFIMDAPNATEMIARYERNDILDTYGEIDYEKLYQNNRDCRVFLFSVPYLTNDKDNKVDDCYFQQFWRNGDAYYNISGKGKMSVQGTSSVQYIKGAANTDINFSILSDGYGNDLLEDGTKDETYGNNWFADDPNNPGHAKKYTVAEAREEAGVTGSEPLGPEWVVVERDANKTPTKYIKALGFKISDSSCPITYSNTKVNFASCEQVNNMCNAAWYQRFNPYPSMTARDCMEFSMGVQFIMDRGEPLPTAGHFRLFPNDNKYHMYSIANMGNSKKNVHVFHDLSNPNEVCIEVNDNNAEQMRMINDDLSAENWSGKVYYGMRYPDTKSPSQTVRDAWQRLVSWMASRNPSAHTDQQLEQPETYGDYVFRGHDRTGTQVLRGVTVTQYAGTYTHDTFERRMARMLSECEDYMVMDSFVYHYLYLERHTMVDNVSKNNFWSSTDLVHWDLSKAYDMDTSDGNNNQGQLVFDYGNEWNDTTGEGKTVFNANDSVWFVFVANLYEACRAMFTNRESAGAWSASAYHQFLLSEQRKVPERCWVQCYWYDYLRTYEQNLGAWMSFLDGGQKTHQRSHYEYFEEMYDASKYRGSVSTSRNINFRAYKPAQWGGSVSNTSGAILRRTASTGASIVARVPYGDIVYVQNTNETMGETWRKVTYGNYTGYMQIEDLDIVEPKSEIKISMYNKMYIAMNAGTTAAEPVKAERGVVYTMPFPVDVDTGGTQIVIYTAPMIQTVSGMEHLFPDTCVFSAATRLRELTIGSDSKGYSNQFLGAASGEALSLENNAMLERLYVQNLPNARSNLVLTNCPSLLYVDATGSGFTGYEFADGGLIETAILNRPTSLVLRNLTHLTDNGLTIADYTGLMSIRFENVPNVNSFTIYDAATSLQIARLIGVSWHLNNSAPIDRLYNLQGLDENGFTVSRAVVTGDAYVPIIRERSYYLYSETWPEFEITYGGFTYSYEVSFYNADGSPILDLNGEPYVQMVDRGEYIEEPITHGYINTPTMEPDAQYSYTFSSWDGITEAVWGPRRVTAVYDTTDRIYTVRWYDEPGGTVLKSVSVTYGTEVTYSDDPYEFPTYTSQEGSRVYYVFTGWDKSTGFVDNNIDVYARWDTYALNDTEEHVVELEDMPIGQIYAIARNNKADAYWNAYDHIDIQVGKDYNFSNVQSRLVAENMYFDGTNPLVTDIQLFKADAPTFTMAIDYEFTSTTPYVMLAGCYDPEGEEGFRLIYGNGGSGSSNPTIQWGSATNVANFGYRGMRGIVVLKHYKGDKTLYIASDKSTSNSSTYSTSVYKTQLTREVSTETNAYLTLGDMSYVTDQEAPHSGWIHWCKIWYADLGDTVIDQIANWPHETWRMHYCGSGRYQEVVADEPCAASFVANALLPLEYTIYSNSGNVGGWAASLMRNLTNGRCFEALPTGWQFVIRKVKVPSSAGNASGTIVYAEDRMYIPAIIEVTPSSTYQAAPYNSEGTRYPWFTSDSETRMKFRSIILPTVPNTADGTMYRQNIDPSEGDPNIETGTVWYSPTAGRVRVYVDEATASKHSYFGNVAKSNSNNIAANGVNGGYWINGSGWATRSPYIGDASNWIRVSDVGGNYSTSSTTGAILLCFSI